MTAEASWPVIVSEQYRALLNDPELLRKLPNICRSFLFALKTHLPDCWIPDKQTINRVKNDHLVVGYHMFFFLLKFRP